MYTARQILMSALAMLAVGTGVSAQSQPVGPGEPAPAYAADTRLRQIVDRALARHPSLDEARRRHQASLEQIAQARALPEPVLGYTQAVQTPETRVGPQFNTLSLSQTLPWFGTRDRRADVARADAGTAAEMIVLRQRDIILQVKAAYYDLAYVDDALRITNDERLLLEQYERLANSRYASGQGSQQAVVKLQAEITRVLSRREGLTGQRAALVARLNALTDDSSGNPIPEIAPVDVPPVIPALDPLLALGEVNRPELRAIGAVRVKRERAVDLARTISLPTVTIGASYVNVLRRRDEAGLAMPPPDNGKNPFSISVNLTLPVRQAKYDAAVQQASQELAAELSRYRSEENRLRLDIEEQLARLETLAEQTDLFERALVPQAQEALRSAETAYATGQVSVLDLLDSERMLLEVRLVLARHRADRLIALARLERAIGTTVPVN